MMMYVQLTRLSIKIYGVVVCVTRWTFSFAKHALEIIFPGPYFNLARTNGSSWPVNTFFEADLADRQDRRWRSTFSKGGGGGEKK